MAWLRRTSFGKNEKLKDRGSARSPVLIRRGYGVQFQMCRLLVVICCLAVMFGCFFCHVGSSPGRGFEEEVPIAPAKIIAVMLGHC